MTTEVDSPRCDMDVHQIVDDPALNMILNLINQVPTAHIKDLNVWQVPVDTKREDSNGEDFHYNHVKQQMFVKFTQGDNVSPVFVII